MRDEPPCLDLDDRPDAARVGRRFVEEQARNLGVAAAADEVALVAAELLANATQHGLPPVLVSVSGDGGRLRVEVRDANSRPPILLRPSQGNMTGRGLALVDALATRWGVISHPGGGKTVWAEFDAAAPRTGSDHTSWVEALPDWDGETAEQRFTVVLGDVSTALLIEAKAHIDNLVREFTLASVGGEAGGFRVPEHLAQLIESVVNNFTEARDSIKRQALAAASRGELRTALTLNLPADAADSGEAYLAGLEQADEYSRAARLLTLETPPEHKLFRRWYVTAVVKQLRALAAGRTPPRTPPFEEVLRAEVRRLASAQRITDRAARLQRVTAALASAQTPEDVADVVVSEGVDALKASGGGLLVPAGDGEHLAVPGSVGYDNDLLGALRDERLDAPLPAATALRTGRPIWLESQEERDREFPALRGFERSTVSMCAVPLTVGDRRLGALRFSFDVRRLFDEDERAFVLALAAQTAQTLERTELYEAERRAALDLQRALLPDRVEIPGWDVAAYYSPADNQEAGGDFYDVLPVAGGKIAAVVGDVMGRGVHAAAAMAQIRATIRAYAIDDADPGTVFRRVDAFFEAFEQAQLVTALYLLVDPDNHTVWVANAGHPPPLLIEGGRSRLIDIPGGPPFGVGTPSRDVVRVQLPDGAALVAITDGLVERRGEDIDEGIERIVRATAGAGDAAARDILDRVVQAASTGRVPDDDVTVLVLRRGEVG